MKKITALTEFPIYCTDGMYCYKFISMSEYVEIMMDGREVTMEHNKMSEGSLSHLARKLTDENNLIQLAEDEFKALYLQAMTRLRNKVAGREIVQETSPKPTEESNLHPIFSTWADIFSPNRLSLCCGAGVIGEEINRCVSCGEPCEVTDGSQELTIIE